MLKLKLKLIYDRQSVCPGVRRPSGICDQFFFRHEISCRQLRLCYFVAPSLMRGRVCNLLLNCFWALPEQSLLGRSPAELTVHILLSHLRLPHPRGPGSRIYIPRNRLAQLYPGALGSLSVASYDSWGLRWRYSNPPPHGDVYTQDYSLLYRQVTQTVAVRHRWATSKGLHVASFHSLV
jgi:hypothetical protein